MSFRNSSVHHRLGTRTSPGQSRYVPVSQPAYSEALAYCASSALRDRLSHAVKTWGDLRFAEDGSGFGELAGAIDRPVLLIATEWIEDDPGVGRLVALRDSHPLASLVLVTRDATRNLLALKDLSVDEVVFVADLGRDLPSALRHAEEGSWLKQVAEEITANARASPLLRRALSHACTAARPFVGIIPLARAMRTDRTALARHWRTVVGGGPNAPRLEDFVDWILVLHAWAVRASGARWWDAANRLGIDVEGLRRRVKRLSGLTLGAFANLSFREVRAIFRSRLLGWLAR